MALCPQACEHRKKPEWLDNRDLIFPRAANAAISQRYSCTGLPPMSCPKHAKGDLDCRCHIFGWTTGFVCFCGE